MKSGTLFGNLKRRSDAPWVAKENAVRLCAVIAHVSLVIDRLSLRPLTKELDKPETPVKIFHMKPQYLEEISAELASCQKHCRVLNGNERFVF